MALRWGYVVLQGVRDTKMLDHARLRWVGAGIRRAPRAEQYVAPRIRVNV